VKYAWIAKQRSTWPTRVMCRLLEVSPSGFYEWLGRGPSARSLEDARLTLGIRQSFELSDRTYGSPRVWHDLRAGGERCGRHRVARLMNAANLKARTRRRRLPGDVAERLEHNIAENRLQREFQADGPNKKWVADFTYVWTAEGWLYVAAVMDLYSRRIVGWSMSDTMHAKMVTDALLMALWRRGRPSQLLLHSDKGSRAVSTRVRSSSRCFGQSASPAA
jgi:putative transposase